MKGRRERQVEMICEGKRMVKDAGDKYRVEDGSGKT